MCSWFLTLAWYSKGVLWALGKAAWCLCMENLFSYGFFKHSGNSHFLVCWIPWMSLALLCRYVEAQTHFFLIPWFLNVGPKNDTSIGRIHDLCCWVSVGYKLVRLAGSGTQPRSWENDLATWSGYPKKRMSSRNSQFQLKYYGALQVFHSRLTPVILPSAAFIRVVGSEFVQKYLGEGPRMVRDVFRLAKENAPAIIFIDEIDAIATKRFDAQTGGEWCPNRAWGLFF